MLTKTVRYLIPPNPYLTPPTDEEVFRFGPPKRESGERITLDRRCRITIDGPRTDGFTGGLGRLVFFRLALLFIPDPTLGHRSVQEFLRIYAEAVAGPSLSFAVEAALPGLGMLPKAALEGWLHGRIPDHEQHALAESYKKHGVWFLPMVDCIEVEAQRDFLHGDKGLKITMGGSIGDRNTLTVQGLDSVDVANGILIYRRLCEAAQMFWVALHKLFLEPVISEARASNMTLEQTQQRIQAVMEGTPLAENLPRICATELELISPLLPAYNVLAPYAKWIGDLEACARGDVNRWAIMTPDEVSLVPRHRDLWCRHPMAKSDRHPMAGRPCADLFSKCQR